MDLNLLGLVKRFTKVWPTGNRPVRMSNVESLITAKCEPDGADLARAGRRYQVAFTSAATGRAPVTAVPTTAAAFLLWNGETDNGKSYVVEDLGIVQLSGTAAIGMTILWALTTVRIAAPTAATGYNVRSCSRSGLQSKAIFADNQTLAVDPSGWAVVTSNGNPATTNGGGDVRDMQGRILVPPGYGLAMTVLSGAGTAPLFLASPMWCELELDLE